MWKNFPVIFVLKIQFILVSKIFGDFFIDNNILLGLIREVQISIMKQKIFLNDIYYFDLNRIRAICSNLIPDVISAGLSKY